MLLHADRRVSERVQLGACRFNINPSPPSSPTISAGERTSWNSYVSRWGL